MPSTLRKAHRSYSRFYIPQAPEWDVLDTGPRALRGLHLRWLNTMTKEEFILRMMGKRGRPGYKLVQGKTFDETCELAIGLGLPKEVVDVKTNRIMNSEYALGAIPVEEHRLRQQESIQEQHDIAGQLADDFDAAIDEIKTDDIRPFRDHPEEIRARKAHAEREDRPFSGQAGGVPITPAS